MVCMYIQENDNNYCELIGKVIGDLVFSHDVYEEKFYIFPILVERLSKSNDYINVTISEKLMSKDLDLSIGSIIKVTGQFRSYNNFSGEGSKLVLTVFIKDVVNVLVEKAIENPNFIILNGFICKEPVYRVTPFEREITDILIAVNRAHGKSDYIPLIAWGRNAKFAANLKIGTNVKVYGRIQSREYQKRLNEEETITKTAYEVSITKIETIQN